MSSEKPELGKQEPKNEAVKNESQGERCWVIVEENQIKLKVTFTNLIRITYRQAKHIRLCFMVSDTIGHSFFPFRFGF